MTRPSRARSGRSGVAWRRNARRRLRGGGGAPDLLLASSPRCLRAPGERRLGPRGCMGSDGTRILGRRPRIALLRCFCAGAAPALLVVLTDVPERAWFVLCAVAPNDGNHGMPTFAFAYSVVSLSVSRRECVLHMYEYVRLPIKLQN